MPTRLKIRNPLNKMSALPSFLFWYTCPAFVMSIAAVLNKACLVIAICIYLRVCQLRTVVLIRTL
jgi:hypothetical protein